MKKRNILIALGIGISAICLACLAVGAIYGSTPSYKATSTAKSALKQTEQAKPTNIFTSTIASRQQKIQLPSNTPLSTRTSSPSNTPLPTFTPSLTSAPTETPPVTGFILISISETASVGSSASAEIRTQPNSTCKLTYILPSGRESTVDGIGEKTADKSGYCSWFWDILGNTNPGTGKIIITAGGKTQTYKIKITE